MVQWDASFETKVTAIDDQHRELVRQINVLGSALKEGKARHTIGDVLIFLGQYAVEHFATEEALMLLHGYPGHAEHKTVHQTFKTEFAELTAQVSADPLGLATTVQVRKRIMEWLKNHILKVDQQLGAFLREKGVK
jgi:hemerythrin